MNRKISLGTAIALMLIMVAATFSITMVYSSGIFSSKMHSITEREAMYTKLKEIDSWSRNNYLNHIDEELLMDAIASGYVDGLNDPYANYYTAEEFARKNQDMSGKTVNIGVAYIQDPSGYLYVTNVYPESPAENAGMKKGDMIVQIDEIDVNAENFAQSIAVLNGEPGTKVNLIIRRDSEDIPLDITRRVVEVPTVSSTKIGNYGYIKIHSFENNTPTHFNSALDSLLNDGVIGLVFDVRNNTGGYINPTCEILDRLLPEGPIVSATYRDGETKLLKASDHIELVIPMVVLTNNKTASSAELFAQALKDYNKAKTIGTTTFGKGVMQTTFSLTDGSALEVTIAKFNPPTSKNFDGVGVKADYEVKLTSDQEKNLIYSDLTQDPQYTKAIDVLNGLVKATGGNPSESGPVIASSSEESEQGEEDEETSSGEGENSSDSESSSSN